MKIGIPKEIKNNENRVSMTPAGVRQFVANNHEVFVETNAGLGSGYTNEEYVEAGATIVESASDAWAQEMVIKVKEPLECEYQYFREDLLLYTYLHLAAEPKLTEALVNSKVTGIAYETVETPDRKLPLLTPMSEVAGRLSVVMGSHYLVRHYGGEGILLSGVPGTPRGKVTIVGGGVAGVNAAKMAMGLGAKVTILDINLDRLRYLDDVFGDDINTIYSNEYNLEQELKDTDLLIGAVLIPGTKAPKLVTEDMVKKMKQGSVIVDIAIDQGGCIETIDRITTHDNPVYEKHGVLHYSVANMPGAVSRTSTQALTNATLRQGLALANKGYIDACLQDKSLYKGINTLKGHVTYKGVAQSLGYDYKEASSLF
ncbi:alanine dehydrogenase [Haloplasma contractile]|uniref:Alanine dehydrogenase n=1 Tax=Haloplasma contractile SSD-17B TaxID=1033810 RepID=U2EBZ1_9MOLU|nr:alanine dehydrogenase [Haloplasma contractile]ERJ12316.1 Alanine dehydrogenase protein [Haloplasma contractile SSD-17B]